MYEPTEKLALQIHSWQVNATIFKVMHNSLIRAFFSGFFVLCCTVDYNKKLKSRRNALHITLNILAFTYQL